MFGSRRSVKYIISTDPEKEKPSSDSMESMDEETNSNDRTSKRPVQSIKMHKIEKIRNFTTIESEYLFLIKNNRLTEIPALRRKSFQKASRTYLMSCLLTLGSVVENARPGRRSNQALDSLLNFLKKHKLSVILRLNSRDIRRLFMVSKQGLLLNRLLKSGQIKLRTTIQTPKLLWRYSKVSFNRFWKLDLPLSVTKPRRQGHVLRGINRVLFEKIAKSRPMVLCRLLKRPEVNRQLAVAWAMQLPNPEILNSLEAKKDNLISIE